MRKITNNNDHEIMNLFYLDSDQELPGSLAAAAVRGLVTTEDADREDKYFPDEETERQLVEICSAIAEYAHENVIPNIMLVDRSSRAAHLGIRKSYNRKYPDEESPNIFFVNPTGFINILSGIKMNHDQLTLDGIAAMRTGRAKYNDSGNFFLTARPKSLIEADFMSTYSGLVDDKDLPLLLVDTCIHSGRSIKPILAMLDKIGFSDVRLLTASDQRNMSGISPDEVVMEDEPCKGCYPFGFDTMIERRFDSVTSNRTRDAEKLLSAIALREEVAQIFRSAPDEWFA